MNDKINISKSYVSFLKYTSRGNLHPSSLVSSEDGVLAVAYLNTIMIGTVSFQFSGEDTKYVLTEGIIEIDFELNPILKVADFIFKDKTIEKYEDLQISLVESFRIKNTNEVECYKIRRIDWSPLDTITNKSYLGVITYDGRIMLYGQNKRTCCWEKEIDLTVLYQKFYKERLLKYSCDSDGVVCCNNVEEYIKLKRDLKLISFSWSSLVRQSKDNQFLMMAVLTESGIVSIWCLISDQIKGRCDLIHYFLLDFRPRILQFCDLSKQNFFLSICLADGRIVGKEFQIVENSNEIGIVLNQENTSLLMISNQSKFSHVNKCIWSVTHKLLIVGYDSQILYVCFDNIVEVGNQVVSINLLDLPSTEEISGIILKDNALYVTSCDGHLFGIKLEVNMENLEINDILIENDASYNNENGEFLDLFMSPNGVHLGLLRRNFSKNGSSSEDFKSYDILLIQMMPEKEILTILMEDKKPFSQKQDAVEEMRHLYFRYKHLLNYSLQKLSKSECQWETSPLHNLQLARYLCIFVGYQLNLSSYDDSTGCVDGTKSFLDFSQIQRIESIIVMKNLKYSLVGFTELTSLNEITQNDCFFVLSLCAKIQNASTDFDTLETIKSAQIKSRSILINQFSVTEIDIDRFVLEASDLSCPLCGESCEFNFFFSKCSKYHIVPRCCKSLELCSDNLYKRCTICGSVEKIVETSTLSYWRLGIVNSNCPLCDGRFVQVKC